MAGRSAAALRRVVKYVVFLGTFLVYFSICIDVDARPRQIGKGAAHLLHLQLGESDGLDCRHRDLRNPDAVRVTVEQEDVDRAGSHARTVTVIRRRPR